MKYKHCPWCGGSPSLRAKSLGGSRGMGYPGHFLYYMQCDTCLSTAPGGKWDDIYNSTEDAKRIAIEVWNKRGKQ